MKLLRARPETTLERIARLERDRVRALEQREARERAYFLRVVWPEICGDPEPQPEEP